MAPIKKTMCHSPKNNINQNFWDFTILGPIQAQTLQVTDHIIYPLSRRDGWCKKWLKNYLWLSHNHDPCVITHRRTSKIRFLGISPFVDLFKHHVFYLWPREDGRCKKKKLNNHSRLFQKMCAIAIKKIPKLRFFEFFHFETNLGTNIISDQSFYIPLAL